jgi:cation diffusion facilitator CzcD-associated flavoprotein CzcO
VFQIHASGYRNPDQLPAGAVLIVGSGASGAQIAEELVRAGSAGLFFDRPASPATAALPRAQPDLVVDADGD